MSFYKELSLYYDEIFAVDKNEMQFISNTLQGKNHILDIGCGTGNKTIHFVSNTNKIEAFDLDEGMILKANTINKHDNINYTVLNMFDIDTKFANSKFDGILCLGNTLVHLQSVNIIEEMLCKIKNLLDENGTFILQILNYDRIIANKIETLPIIDTEHTKFYRKYIWQDDKMHFATAIEIKQTGEKLQNDIVLYPLCKAELAAMLLKCGFSSVDYFGSYTGATFQEDSFVNIAVCRA